MPKKSTDPGAQRTLRERHYALIDLVFRSGGSNKIVADEIAADETLRGSVAVALQGVPTVGQGDLIVLARAHRRTVISVGHDLYGDSEPAFVTQFELGVKQQADKFPVERKRLIFGLRVVYPLRSLQLLAEHLDLNLQMVKNTLTEMREEVGHCWVDRHLPALPLR